MEAVHGLNGYSLAIILHVLLFVYWLGGDLGVYYSSRFILRPELSPESRAVAARIMHGCDLAPRVSLVLFLPSGISLMAAGPLGEEFFVRGPLLALVWIAGLAWLYVSVMDFRGGGSPALARFFHRADLVVRYGLTVVLLAIAAYTMVAAEPFGVDTNPTWLGAKLAAYALCIGAGVMIRWQLRTFGPAFGALMASGSTPEVEAGIRGSIRRCEPYVYAIWLLVLAAAVLGVIKPGSTAF